MSQESAPDTITETELLYNLVKDTHLLTPVVLIGASALVPVPFLDDIAKAYLEKRLFTTIAEREGQTLSKLERERLTQRPSSGCCALGCLGSAFLYPVKRILRKVFYFLEIKRAVDQATTALAQAWLFQLTLKRGLWQAGKEIEKTDRLREVIDEACRSQGVKPLETAIGHAFEGAKDTLFDFASKFSNKTGRDEKEVAVAMKRLETEKSGELADITQKLSDSLQDVPDSYLEKFAFHFETQLAAEMRKPLNNLPT